MNYEPMDSSPVETVYVSKNPKFPICLHRGQHFYATENYHMVRLIIIEI